MIAVENIKVFENQKAFDRGDCTYTHVIDTITAIIFDGVVAKDKQYTVGVMFKNSPNGWIIFDSNEKCNVFYEALKTLLPDNDNQLKSIDCKDFY